MGKGGCMNHGLKIIIIKKNAGKNMLFWGGSGARVLPLRWEGIPGAPVPAAAAPTWLVPGRRSRCPLSPAVAVDFGSGAWGAEEGPRRPPSRCVRLWGVRKWGGTRMMGTCPLAPGQGEVS